MRVSGDITSSYRQENELNPKDRTQNMKYSKESLGQKRDRGLEMASKTFN